MIQYHKKFIRIAECWADEKAPDASVDLVRLFQQTEPRAGMFCREFYTILLDLRQSDDALLGNMKKDTRYEIRRATTDNLVYEIFSESEPRVVSQFCDYYDQFAANKAQPKQNRQWLSLLGDNGALTLSRVREPAGKVLVWHAYHRAVDRVTLLYSASLFRDNPSSEHRNRVGRANRYHHWHDMLHFKSQGISTYDFGGWYEGKENLERLSINKFKEEFGGVVVRNYICEQGKTLKGKMFLLIRLLLLGNAI